MPFFCISQVTVTLEAASVLVTTNIELETGPHAADVEAYLNQKVASNAATAFGVTVESYPDGALITAPLATFHFPVWPVIDRIYI